LPTSLPIQVATKAEQPEIVGIAAAASLKLWFRLLMIKVGRIRRRRTMAYGRTDFPTTFGRLRANTSITTLCFLVLFLLIYHPMLL
jgi:hypothetical protein